MLRAGLWSLIEVAGYETQNMRKDKWKFSINCRKKHRTFYTSALDVPIFVGNIVICDLYQVNYSKIQTNDTSLFNIWCSFVILFFIQLHPLCWDNCGPHFWYFKHKASLEWQLKVPANGSFPGLLIRNICIWQMSQVWLEVFCLESPVPFGEIPDPPWRPCWGEEEATCVDNGVLTCDMLQ